MLRAVDGVCLCCVLEWYWFSSYPYPSLKSIISSIERYAMYIQQKASDRVFDRKKCRSLQYTIFLNQSRWGDVLLLIMFLSIVCTLQEEYDLKSLESRAVIESLLYEVTTDRELTCFKKSNIWIEMSQKQFECSSHHTDRKTYSKEVISHFYPAPIWVRIIALMLTITNYVNI